MPVHRAASLRKEGLEGELERGLQDVRRDTMASLEVRVVRMGGVGRVAARVLLGLLVRRG